MTLSSRVFLQTITNGKYFDRRRSARENHFRSRALVKICEWANIFDGFVYIACDLLVAYTRPQNLSASVGEDLSRNCRNEDNFFPLTMLENLLLNK